MKYYLRIVDNKWFSKEEAENDPNLGWLSSDELPSRNLDGVGNFTNNEMSVYRTNGSLDEVINIISGYSTTNGKDKLFGILIPAVFFEKNEFDIVDMKSVTAYSDIDKLHTNIRFLSLEDTVEIMQYMYKCQKIPVSKTSLYERLTSLVDQGKINSEFVNASDRYKKKIGLL